MPLKFDSFSANDIVIRRSSGSILPYENRKCEVFDSPVPVGVLARVEPCF